MEANAPQVPEVPEVLEIEYLDPETGNRYTAWELGREAKRKAIAEKGAEEVSKIMPDDILKIFFENPVIERIDDSLEDDADPEIVWNFRDELTDAWIQYEIGAEE